MIIWPLIRPPTTRLRTRNESWKLKSRRWRRSWRPTALEAFAGSDHRHFLSEYHHTRAGSSYQRNLIIKTSPPIDSSWWQLLPHKNIQTPGQPAPHWLHCLLLPLLFAWGQNPLRLRGDDHHHDYRDHHYDGEITNMIAVMIVVFMLRLSSFEGQQHQV